MSGRGLGHTGGTIDKLEAINGYNVELEKDVFLKQVNDIGIAVISQTGNLAPADKKLYALRDVTGTVESIPLIAASIMSKKIASGSKYILLDVKVGNGALMKNIEDAKKLAQIMIEIGKKYERKVICMLTNMDEPLGYAIGNGLEVKEAIDALNLHGPRDLNTIVINMAAMALKEFKDITFEQAVLEVKECLINKNALTKLNDLVTSQKGDINNIAISSNKLEIKSCDSGYIKSINAYKLGEAAKLLGAGRTKKEDKIDYGVGIVLSKKVGDFINADEVLLTIYYNDETNIEFVKNNISNYFELSKDKVEPLKLILDVIS
jgi:pyrimidine-nucleoside phosphorylase